jgi:hypothetical protein
VTRANSGQFTPGVRSSPRTEFKARQRVSPRTEFKRGEHKSPKTEFVRGQAAHNRLPLGAETIRVDINSQRRAWVKVAEPSKWMPRAVVAWESVNGPLPRGLIVHHKDRDSLNDDPSNLVALTRKEHAAAHRDDLNQFKADALVRKSS